MKGDIEQERGGPRAVTALVPTNPAINYAGVAGRDLGERDAQRTGP